MPCYIKGNKLFNNRVLRKNSIDKNVITSHINTSTTNRLIGKNPSTSMKVYSSQNPYGGPIDAGIWVRNPDCWLNGVSNISCFSPAQRSGANWWQRGGTLITRKHALFAKHFVTSILPNGGTPLIFVDENNNAIRRNIIQYAYDTNDIAIALLDSEVPANIKIAKVLPPNFIDYIKSISLTSSPNSFEFRPMLYSVCLDQEEKASVKLLNRINPSIPTSLGHAEFLELWWSAGFMAKPTPYPEEFNGWGETVIVGDSGNPVFLIIDNELVVLTTWLTPTAGPFITSRYNEVNNIIESLSPGEGYSLTPIDLEAVYNKYYFYNPTVTTINSVNYNSTAILSWLGLSSWNNRPITGPTTVGSNGGPSFYGTYDQSGLVIEITEIGNGSPNSLVCGRGGFYQSTGDQISKQGRLLIDPAHNGGLGTISSGFRICSINNQLNLPNFVTVGNANNPNDELDYPYGSVSYTYLIDKYPVTNCDYVKFLNSVDPQGTNPQDIFPSTVGDPLYGISFNPSGANGSKYSSKINMSNKPVTKITWFRAARYCNWLHNGRLSYSTTDSSSSAPQNTGAYNLDTLTSGNTIQKNSLAQYYIPTENEWYKAAFYKGGGWIGSQYWIFATQTDTYPDSVTASDIGDGILNGKPARIPDYTC